MNCALHRLRHTDSARLGETLQLRGHVHGVAGDIAEIDDQLAKINPNAALEVLLIGQLFITCFQLVLYLHGTDQGLRRSVETRQHRIAGMAKYAPAVKFDGVAHDIGAAVEASRCPFCVFSGQTAACGHTRTQYRRQLAFDGSCLFRAVNRGLDHIGNQPIAALISLSATMLASGIAEAADPASSDAAIKEMQEVLGGVPAELQLYPESARAAGWALMKSTDLNKETALPAKQRELNGLAVAAQIPCQYCAYYHMKAAKAAGAGEEEIREAVHQASLTRHWSTILYGNQYDLDADKSEVDAAFK